MELNERIAVDRIKALNLPDIAGTKASFSAMHQRCNNPKATGFHNYGGRNISVCERWTGRKGFNNFVSDIGYRPNKSLSIDRNDNNGNYDPLNCKWATRSEQQANRRSKAEIEAAKPVFTWPY